MLNTTFKYISVTTFVVEIGVPREIQRTVASHWQTLSHNVLSSTPRHECGSNSQLKWWWATIAQVVVNSTGHTTTTAQVQLIWKVIVLLILMEFMIITVYKLFFISINENNWFAENMFFVGVHWLEFVSHVKFRHNVRHIRTIPFLLPPDWDGWPLNFTITDFL